MVEKGTRRFNPLLLYKHTFTCDRNNRPEDLPVNEQGRQQSSLADQFLLKQFIDFSNPVFITSSQKRSVGTAAIFLELTQSLAITIDKKEAFFGLYYGDYSTMKDGSQKPKDAVIDKPVFNPSQWSQEIYKEHKQIKKILKSHLQNDREDYHKKLEEAKKFDHLIQK